MLIQKQKENNIMETNQVKELKELIERVGKLQVKSEEEQQTELDLPATLFKLRSNLESYTKAMPKIEVGDILVWKEGLKNRKYPKYNEPCIVVEVLKEPILNDAIAMSSSYYKESNDVKLGIILSGNEFVTFFFDSRRFTKFDIF